MDVKEHVTSLDLSKRLAELGVKQESLFCWWRYSDKNKFPCISYTKGKMINDDHCSAFISSELGGLIPYELFDQNLTLTKCWGCWEIKYEVEDPTIGTTLVRVTDETQSNAMANMLIHLIENKIWVPE